MFEHGTTKLRETAATQEEYDEVLGVDLIPFLLLLLSCCHDWGRVDFMDKCFFENFKRITINLVERKPTTLAHSRMTSICSGNVKCGGQKNRRLRCRLTEQYKLALKNNFNHQ